MSPIFIKFIFEGKKFFRHRLGFLFLLSNGKKPQAIFKFQPFLFFLNKLIFVRSGDKFRKILVQVLFSLYYRILNISNLTYKDFLKNDPYS
ncbi:hypothetical protein LEP1GSC187_2827 [Leptospira santarosai str. ZUN179]|uniref:Uncharacterized protein n=1 Tax=Leptospira santarosai str. ZUN179 TaxID=1049985 RepID=M6UQZ6_9LEPT|nr:hypothetical protein LEP1GSC187_2827 [Leptospira santarosai str. ZUN179]